jgi:hypothetical protein
MDEFTTAWPPQRRDQRFDLFLGQENHDFEKHGGVAEAVHNGDRVAPTLEMKPRHDDSNLASWDYHRFRRDSEAISPHWPIRD